MEYEHRNRGPSDQRCTRLSRPGSGVRELAQGSLEAMGQKGTIRTHALWSRCRIPLLGEGAARSQVEDSRGGGRDAVDGSLGYPSSPSDCRSSCECDGLPPRPCSDQRPRSPHRESVGATARGPCATEFSDPQVPPPGYIRWTSLGATPIAEQCRRFSPATCVPRPTEHTRPSPAKADPA